MNGFLQFVKREPVAISAFVAALLTLLVTFNVVGSNSVNPILGVVGAALALAGGVAVRAAVTPVSKIAGPTDPVSSGTSNPVVPPAS